MQPLISEALEMSTTADIQLKVLKEYQAFAQQKANETSAMVLQEVVDKEQAADTIMRDLNKRFTILVDKVHLSEEQQSVPGRDTNESQGPIGACTLRFFSCNSVGFVEVL